jgi:class 3 adenylate cyclase
VVKTILAPAEGVRLIKEIGDAVLLSCRDFTPLLESVLLMEQVAYQMASAPDDPEFPFGIRVGISNGPAKKLLRESEDFLGRPIDELARIMAVRSSRSNILIHESVYRVAKDLLSEYGSFLSVGDAEMVPSDIAKGAREPIWYRELLIDRVAMGHHRDGFSSWREVKS